jgi:hypothetical protein
MGPVDIGRSVALGREHDPAAVGGKRRIEILVCPREKRPWISAISVGDEDLRIERSESRISDRVRRLGRPHCRDGGRQAQASPGVVHDCGV